MNKLTIVERKIYGALVAQSNEDGVVNTSKTRLAHSIGYKGTGGIITYALSSLQMKNYVEHLGGRNYKVFV